MYNTLYRKRTSLAQCVNKITALFVPCAHLFYCFNCVYYPFNTHPSTTTKDAHFPPRNQNTSHQPLMPRRSPTASGVLLPVAVVAASCMLLFLTPSPASASSVVLTTMGNIDYKATFDNLSREGCGACVKAGYGWDEATKRCGGFENDRCPGSDGGDDDDWDEEEDLEGFATKGDDQSDDDESNGGDVDYVKLFAKLTTQGCVACVKAGYGWSEDRQKCGGFENTVCDGEHIEAEDDDEGEEGGDEAAPAHPDWKDTAMTTRLWKLISGAKYEQLKELLDEDPKIAKTRAADGRGPLFWAHEYSQMKMVSLLVLKGADSKAKDKDGRTPGDIADSSDVIDHADDDAADDDDEGVEASSGGTDMGSLFKRLTKEGCRKCVNSGYGWCPIKNMCGGFANRKCHDGLDKDATNNDDEDDDLEGFATRI